MLKGADSNRSKNYFFAKKLVQAALPKGRAIIPLPLFFFLEKTFGQDLRYSSNWFFFMGEFFVNGISGNRNWQNFAKLKHYKVDLCGATAPKKNQIHM